MFPFIHTELNVLLHIKNNNILSICHSHILYIVEVFVVNKK